MLTVLHFADAHIDIAGHGRHDPLTGLPLRVLDFLNALDRIVDTAIDERVDLVLFAGDAYKDRTPSPTYQREWGRRIMRLAQAGIPTLLLIGNHDLSPAAGRANALQEFDTLQVPHIQVLSKPAFLGPTELENLPLQVLAIPWISRSGLMAALEMSASQPEKVLAEIEERLSQLIQGWLESADPQLPTILTAHASVEGAQYGSERSVMLGSDMLLPGSLVRDARLDYVALGHIHKAQNLNENGYPPVVYPGSIERVDFGEAQDEKSFVIARIERGRTVFERRLLPGRRFIDRKVSLTSPENVLEQMQQALPPLADLAEAVVRLVVDYPREYDPYLDEPALRKYTEAAFEFHLVRRPQMQTRFRLPDDVHIEQLSASELLDKYWEVIKTSEQDRAPLQKLAEEIISTSASTQS
ncbi:MAG: exonuclease SbcCD subunit D [Anaerolineaceae bacterium]